MFLENYNFCDEELGCNNEADKQNNNFILQKKLSVATTDKSKVLEETESNQKVIFNEEEYFIKKYPLESPEDFVKDQWPFLTFIFILGILIISIIYIKKQKYSSKNNEDFSKIKKETYEEEIKNEADKYEIEEILKK